MFKFLGVLCLAAAGILTFNFCSSIFISLLSFFCSKFVVGGVAKWYFLTSLKIWCFCILFDILFEISALGTGDFIVLHTPKTVIFKGNEEVDQSFLKEVFSAALGFTASSQVSPVFLLIFLLFCWLFFINKSTFVLIVFVVLKLLLDCKMGLWFLQKSWSGMTITDPFALPEAIVAIAIEDVDSLKDSSLGKTFPLNSDEVEEYTWQALSQKMQKRYTPTKLDLVRFYLGDGIDAVSNLRTVISFTFF